MPEKAENFTHQLQARLRTIEKRDWQLWVLALTMVAILTGGYFFVIFPAVFLHQHTFYFAVNISSTLVIGQLALVALFLIYLIHNHMQVRKMRAESMFEALNYQVVSTQLLLDPLTQAFNRSALEEILAKEIKRIQRQQGSMMLLYVDVDGFKKVNTRFGHLSGDLVLTDVGTILKNSVRGSDYVIRMGGDEFLAGLLDTDEAGAEVVKDRIKRGAEKWNANSPLRGYKLTLSIGVQRFDGTRSFDEVLSEADTKMYAEKKAGT